MAERPTSQGYYLGEQLRRLRSARGLSMADAAGRVGISEAKLSRIERGLYKVKATDMTRLLDLYEVTDLQRSHLLHFAEQQQARATGWWREHRGHSSANVPQYVALEQIASRLRTIEPTLIPGLLQTPAYARVVLRARWDGLELGRESEARITRRRRLVDGDLEATFLIGEAALRMIPDGARADQLKHLLEFAELPNVQIRLIPLGEIAYLTLGNPLVLLSFDLDDLADVAYVEHWLGSFVVDDPADVSIAQARFETIEKGCLTSHDTTAWISDISGV